MTHHVAIVGAGFSGTLQAINLLRHDGPRATLIERAETPGLGLAYGAARPDHILNVRAGNMSALPDDPGHFVRWLEKEGVADAARQFAPRKTFGRYLKAMLDDAVANCGGRLNIVRGEVTQVDHSGGGARISLADGQSIDADAAVLAVGNLPPHTPPGIDPDALTPPRYFGDPWAADVTDGLSDEDAVLIIGTGLTMIDSALSLDAAGFRGRIIALSRRGLLPRAHEAPGASWERIAERPETVASELVGSLRQRSAAIGWRNAVDELRPFTQFMWGNASEAERSRFLRHLRPWWDVHRHRLAPEVAARIEALRANGRLTIVSGKTMDAREHDDGVAVEWRPRGHDKAETLVVQRIINCTGPLGDLDRTTDPLLRDLTARGLIRADAHRIGIDVDNQARTIAATGQPNDWLYALGPMTRGAFWEIVAVPDIRQQTWALARRLSNAHWVGGEGL
ncbi:FAD/NAD(P)-binding protein [Sphingomonas sp. AX6]|uniref:FAD/NAD(P)-binding protein n=1 Tax=Sphingomonas sp. AX6 TaxID=2653171 RepID=UPI0012F20EF2|nr:FAD/NAD(P)-binding protein [Sphingomonas sp. AX6]VXC86544.1 Hydroxyacylglutathione hydrolase [Sphingomonas sp. AX6]